MSPSETDVGAQCIRPSSSKFASGSLCQKVGVSAALLSAVCPKITAFCAAAKPKTNNAGNNNALNAIVSTVFLILKNSFVHDYFDVNPNRTSAVYQKLHPDTQPKRRNNQNFFRKWRFEHPHPANPCSYLKCSKGTGDAAS